MKKKQAGGTDMTEATWDIAGLERLLLQKGAWRIGAADLSQVPEEQRRGYPRALSILVPVDLSIINGLTKGVTKEYINEYRSKNLLLDELAETASAYIEAQGYHAFPLSRKNVSDDYSIHSATLPHKTVATRAGLGWIGKNALLVTFDRGSAVRLTSVLTDAPFLCAVPEDESHCGACRICTETCPGQAPLGINWSVGSRREDFFDVLACRKTCITRTWNVSPGESLCGLCILACPHTRRAIRMQGLEYRYPEAEIAGAGDADEIIALQKIAYREEGLRCGCSTIAPLRETPEQLRDAMLDPRRALLVFKIVQQRRIVGSIRAYEEDGICHIGRLMVHPDFQKRGLGERLLATAERSFSGAEYELFTGEKSISNIAFYEKRGYRRFRTSEADGVSLVYFRKRSR